MRRMNDEEQKLLAEFEQKRWNELLWGEPEHTCAEPKREFWIANVPGNCSPQMIAISNGHVYAMRDDMPVPRDKPFGLENEITLIRRCTGFDF